ncbi:hypothetical protein [Azospirillum argentinense]|uniref:Uncharacterized protein n=1 Tax=Azospirillum brasilense TaxID=192 RepID=A0A4D8QAN4_AZOBR|nr:hypothetical protein [Azospirillum argentinense]QCO07445.1 hypothetical protein D3867_36795 [Azospirillum argentinense]
MADDTRERDAKTKASREEAGLDRISVVVPRRLAEVLVAHTGEQALSRALLRAAYDQVADQMGDTTFNDLFPLKRGRPRMTPDQKKPRRWKAKDDQGIS